MKCKKLGSNELLIAGSTYDKEECGFPTGLIVTDKKLQKGTHYYRYIGKEGKKASLGEKGEPMKTSDSAPEDRRVLSSPRIPESLTSGEQIEQYVKETMKEALDKIDKKKSVSLTKDEELYVQDSLEDLKAGRFTVSGKNETVKKKLENLKYKLMCWDEIERIHKIIKPMYGKKKTGNPKR